ncbi:MAG: GNAT family N-acetyltransferase, partial [Candidatus Electryonea clarkiae]|nr:GNAT family N-acetyltransferase [Candidatus Electryonea clarkiae]
KNRKTWFMQNNQEDLISLKAHICLKNTFSGDPNYKDVKDTRLSFHELTNTVFGFDLEDWYQKGFWSDRYNPYSFIVEGRVVANVSINKMDVVLAGQRHKAIQIGTVMTHPDYQKRGLAAKLMKHVLEIYAVDYHLFYLFANNDVLNFYPKFGFESLVRSQFVLDRKNITLHKLQMKKLDISKPEILNMVYQMVTGRKPVSNVFGIENGQNLFMYHCLYILNDCIYYLEEENILILCKKEGKALHIYDIVYSDESNFKKLAGILADEDIERFVFRFTPDLLNVDTISSLLETDDGFFVKSDSIDIKGEFLSPLTAEA